MSRLLFSSTVLIALALAGCQTTPAVPDATQETSARERIGAGDYAAAGAEYERLATEKRALRDHYRLLAAEAWREEAEFDDVARLLGEIKRKKLDAEQNLRYDLLQAELALNRQQPAQASSLLAVAQERVPAAVRERWLELQARAFQAEGRRLDAARTRLRLIALLPATERREAQRELLDLIAASAPDSLRADLAPLAAGDALRPWLERALRASGEAPARAAIEPTEAVGTMLSGSNGELQREGFAALGKLAVLLPTSGEYAAAGKAILDGVLAAHYHAPAATAVQVYDAGGTRRSALEAYRQALADGVDAVLGPVERDQVDAILEADDRGPVVLALNHPEPKTLGAEDSFRFGLVPEDEAAFAAERMIAEGARRIAVFGTNEDWSERALATFDAQVRVLGGSISGHRVLRDSDVDFTDAIGALIGAPGTASPEGRTDAVFLAVRNSTARLLVPQLRVSAGSDLPILATSHVFGGSLQPASDKDLDGLVFLDAPWAHGDVVGLPGRDALGSDLGSAAHSPRLFAFGLDAYRLMPYLAHLRMHPGRYLEGASGLLLADAFGRIRRLPQMFRFVQGTPQPASALRLVVEPAP